MKAAMLGARAVEGAAVALLRLLLLLPALGVVRLASGAGDDSCRTSAGQRELET